MGVRNSILFSSSTDRGAGFTLVEMAITVAIGAILMASAVPAFQGIVLDNRMAARINTLVTGLSQARAQTIYSGYNVVLCPSNDGSSCWKHVRWDQGWISFLDRNGDGKRTPEEPILRHEQAREGVEIHTSARRTRITFRSVGSRLGAGTSAGSNATFTFCDGRGPAHTAAVILSNTGRPRTVKPAPPGSAARCPR